MKLRTKFILFVTILHLLTLVLTFYIFKNDKPLFILSEVFVIISVLIAWNLYRQLIQPLKFLMTGIEAIKDQDFNVEFLPTGKHEVDQMIGVYNQMIARLRTERTIQEQQHFFLEKLINTSPTGIIILDFDEQIQQINPKALQLLQLNEKDIIKHKAGDLQGDFFQHITSLNTGETKTVRLAGHTTVKIQRSHFIDRGFPRHFIMIEEMTAEIIAAEKNAYGKVIRMMAHEVNNTIGPVNSIIQSSLATNALWQVPDTIAIHDALQVAMERNYNLNIFMRNFADLVKLPEPRTSKTDLNKLLQNVVKLMELPAKERHIALKFDGTDPPFYITADEQLLEQALVNIVKNAIEAIDKNGEINLVLDYRNRTLKIQDTGKGISDKESELLFTPFFSTKKDGQGIGLTLVREILVKHGFSFALKTIQQNYTVFLIKF
ncbi:HAMP domain-containing protein [Mucilaginibacter limnophilus]|uniref:histidine kinase n=1 Tax=Mucilaginibacter limnophilus TaxID=1932778 RepID=A0A3S2UNJ0_9SPHI|nr:ATP-binding protein [Mucilaginibacter limnophilus]RVU02830.1 HAMP domain-containing protein [Mucilaginibacter limnophilus]